MSGASELIDFEYVEAKLESAGRTMMMLHVPGCWPAGYRSCNPEVVRDFADMIGVPHDDSPQKMRASTAQVTEYEEVMGWIQSLAEYCKQRKMIYVARAVCHAMPRKVMTGKRVNSWRAIGRRFGGVDHKTAKSWYEEGVSIIVRQINEKKLLAERGGGKRSGQHFS